MKANSRNLTSKAYTGSFTLDQNLKRGYFMIVMTSGSGTVTVGVGDGAIPLDENVFWEPYICPTSELTVTMADEANTCVVVTG